METTESLLESVRERIRRAPDMSAVLLSRAEMDAWNSYENDEYREKCSGGLCPVPVLEESYPRPIPLSERLPSGDIKWILVWDASSRRAGWRIETSWDWEDVSPAFTHWLPLPPAPEVEG